MARRSKWDYNPESWKYMSRSKDYGCAVFIAVALVIGGSIIAVL